ncbi:MAG: hypothetical protein F4206_13375 [Gammaproteobacteria bacterium]|nr:hypothetical protein [Gammaproteobacteria bacterium]
MKQFLNNVHGSFWGSVLFAIVAAGIIPFTDLLERARLFMYPTGSILIFKDNCPEGWVDPNVFFPVNDFMSNRGFVECFKVE